MRVRPDLKWPAAVASLPLPPDVLWEICRQLARTRAALRLQAHWRGHIVRAHSYVRAPLWPALRESIAAHKGEAGVTLLRAFRHVRKEWASEPGSWIHSIRETNGEVLDLIIHECTTTRLWA